MVRSLTRCCICGEILDCMKMKPCQLGFSNHLSTKDEVIENIEKIGNSAAAVLCNVSRVVPFQDRDDYLMKDIIGVVALLGRVHSMRLSRSNIHPFSQSNFYLVYFFFFFNLFLNCCFIFT